MNYKKILLTSAVVCSMFAMNLQAIADSSDPVQVHPARTNAFDSPAVTASTPSAKASPKNGGKVSASKGNVSKNKKSRRHKIKRRKPLVITKVIIMKPPKPKPVVINLDNVEKLIENNNFTEADSLLKTAIAQKNKDLIKAQSLQTILFAKRGLLNDAQKQLDALLKQNPKNSNLHYAQGIVYFKKASDINYRAQMQDYLSKAESEFRTATILDKKNYRAYNALGVKYLKDGMPKDASASFNSALGANPKYSTAWDNLGTIDYQQGNLEKAQKEFLQAVTFNPNNATAMYHLAMIEYGYGNYLNATNYLMKSLAIRPNYALSTNLLGQIYQKQGYDVAAIDMFKKAASQNSQLIIPYFNLASLYEKRGDSEFAINELKNAISLNPVKYRFLKLKLADMSMLSGKYDQAIDNYSALVGDKDFNDSALKGLSNAYFAKAQSLANKGLFTSNQDLYKALDNIEKAIQNNPNDMELHLAKLKLAQITNQPALSEAVLNGIIKSPATDLTSKVTKGEAYLTLCDYKNAQLAFNDAIKNAKNINDKMQLAEIFTYHKQYNPAKTVLQLILKDDNKNLEAINTLDYITKCEKIAMNDYDTGNYYLKKKIFPAAMEYYNRSIALNPNNPNAHLKLANMYEKKKDYPLSIQNYKAYLGLTDDKKGVRKINRKIKRMTKKLPANL
jgi:tetratricopeptide (TPR) repeat protein